MLDVKQLRVLKEVAEHGSFSSAAAALSYSQPAVSQQIAALERHAGARLLDRTSRGVRLTDAGRALVGHTDAILARLADAEAELEAIRELRGGQIRLASFPTGGASLIPVATAAFRRRHPGIDISLSVAVMEGAVERLKTGEVDVALLVEPGFGPEPRDAKSSACICSTIRCSRCCPPVIGSPANGGCGWPIWRGRPGCMTAPAVAMRPCF